MQFIHTYSQLKILLILSIVKEIKYYQIVTKRTLGAQGKLNFVHYLRNKGNSI